MNVSDANEIRFFIGATAFGCSPSLPSTPLQSPWRQALPHTQQPRFIRQGARSTAAATTARIARTYLRARVSAISDIHPDAVARTHACPNVFLRSNRWTGLSESDALAASRGVSCRRHDCAF